MLLGRYLWQSLKKKSSMTDRDVLISCAQIVLHITLWVICWTVAVIAMLILLAGFMELGGKMSLRKAERACRRKEAFSKKEAEEIAILRNAQKGRGGYAYHCASCGWWHITKGR